MSQEKHEAPIRVAVWGAGGVARCLIRECLRRPEIEIVGVYARDQGKVGQDAGQLFGDPPAGIPVTDDKSAILASHPDVLLHVPRTTIPVETGSEIVTDVCDFLAAGINVVSSAAFHFPSYSTPDVTEALEAACKRGRSAIHATGINPGLLCERWVVGLTAGMSIIKSVLVQECADVAGIPSLGMLQSLGIGADPEALRTKPAGNSQRYFGEAVTGTCRLIGYTIERVEHECVGIPAQKAIELPLMTIQVGQSAGLVHRYTGYVDGRPFFTLEEYQYADPSACPVPLDGAPYLATATIEAEPTSVSMRIGLQASILKNRGLRVDGTRPTYNTTAAAMLNAIPEIIGEVGIVYSRPFGAHTPDIRRKSRTTSF
jgi:2,4-diaminopentanoate dehydrogenase